MLKEIGQIRFWARFPGTVKPPAAQAVAPGARHARGGYPRRRARRSGRPGMPGIIRPSTWARECAACSRTKLRNRGSPGGRASLSRPRAGLRHGACLPGWSGSGPGHPCRPRFPEASASRKAAERLSDCTRAGKTTACGVVSLRRHCPDQVPGGRRSASELSPASQPFLPAPDLPGTPLGPAPSITSQTIFTLHGADDRFTQALRPGPGRRNPSAETARGMAAHPRRRPRDAARGLAR